MKKYIVYGRSTCPYCIKVVNKLLRGGKTFYVELHDNNPEKLDEIKKKFNHLTIPIVTFIDDSGYCGEVALNVDSKGNTEMLIGGCDDTIFHLKNEVPNDTSET